jgi:hypothetical protein
MLLVIPIVIMLQLFTVLDEKLVPEKSKVHAS